ncbi:MAG TPA: hypothetical protein VGA99_08485 [bacterium]
MNTKQRPILENDLVLIHFENKPMLYARVEKIGPDIKPKWWQVKFLMLTIPPQIVTWIIDDEQIRGADFTMGGTSIRIEKLVLPETVAPQADPEPTQQKEGQKARVLSLHKKKP